MCKISSIDNEHEAKVFIACFHQRHSRILTCENLSRCVCHLQGHYLLGTRILHVSYKLRVVIDVNDKRAVCAVRLSIDHNVLECKGKLAILQWVVSIGIKGLLDVNLIPINQAIC